jgi:uncharacterized protein (TIGR03083 family)
MTDDSDLDGLDPYDLMEQETARLDRFFSTLEARAWERPSRCEGWSVRDLLAHLASSEEYNRASLDGTVASFLTQLGERGVTDLASANDLGIRDFDGVPTEELLDTWRTRARENREGLRARDGGDIDSTVGAYPARWQAFHLAFELAIHADDVSAPIGVDEEPGRTAWLARFARFALKETKPDAHADGHDGRTRVRGDGVDVELRDDDFVRVATGRAPDDAELDAEVRAYLVVT